MAESTLGNILESMDGAARILATLFTPMLRTRRLRWGATDAEVSMRLPGDDFVTKPIWSYTYAVTVHAPAAAVWRWVVQMGYGRGGLYSYQGLENLTGSDMRNADEIVPEWQHLSVGDPIRIDARVPPLTVALIEPGRALVLGGKATAPNLPDHTWGFYLVPVDALTTRLISRSRTSYLPTTGNKLAWGPLLMEPIGFVMERKMLLGIKRRAETQLATYA